MSLTYNKIKTSTKAFHNLTRISVSLFDSLIEKLRPFLERIYYGYLQKEGHPYNHGIERTSFNASALLSNLYNLSGFLGFLFDIDHSLTQSVALSRI